jgi:hypothetical protein
MDFTELPRPTLGLQNVEETAFLKTHIDELRYYRGKVTALRSCSQPRQVDGKTVRTDEYRELAAHARRLQDQAKKLGYTDIKTWLRSENRITTLYIGAVPVKELF